MLTFDPITLSPSEFEEAVRAILDAAGVPLNDYKSSYLAPLSGFDGDHIIDVSPEVDSTGRVEQLADTTD